MIWVGKVNQILHCDWLPDRVRWRYLDCSGLPAVSHKKQLIDRACSVKMAELDIGLVVLFIDWLIDWLLLFFCKFMDLDSISASKHTKKELSQHPAILTSCLVNYPYNYIRVWERRHYVMVSVEQWFEVFGKGCCVVYLGRTLGCHSAFVCWRE